MLSSLSPETWPVLRVLILKADRFYAEALKTAVSVVLPGCQIEIANRLVEAVTHAAQAPIDLLITGIVLLDGDVMEFLSGALTVGGNVRRAFVVTGRKEPRAFAHLKDLRISGVFDSTAEGLNAFQSAVAAVARGEGYWSQSVIDRVYGHKAAHLYRNLTPGEQRVLAEIGDGSDDKDAAKRLGMTQASVHGIRRKLHRKLGVSHRGDLIRHAVFMGFVRFAYETVQRPGREVTSKRSLTAPSAA